LTDPGQIPRAIAQASRQEAGALLALTSPMVNISLRSTAEAALEHHLPAMCGFAPTFAEAGGLLAYGPDFTNLFRRAAAYVIAISRGRRPASF
jgi:putative ABC transport system substrate-binding protein